MTVELKILDVDRQTDDGVPERMNIVIQAEGSFYYLAFEQMKNGKAKDLISAELDEEQIKSLHALLGVLVEGMRKTETL